MVNRATKTLIYHCTPLAAADEPLALQSVTSTLLSRVTGNTLFAFNLKVFYLWLIIGSFKGADVTHESP